MTQQCRNMQPHYHIICLILQLLCLTELLPPFISQTLREETPQVQLHLVVVRMSVPYFISPNAALSPKFKLPQHLCQDSGVLGYQLCCWIDDFPPKKQHSLTFQNLRMLNNIVCESKHLFIIPTDANNYKTTGMLKTIKIRIIALTCFGSRRNHHQGAISCLAKTTIMILLCLFGIDVVNVIAAYKPVVQA